MVVATDLIKPVKGAALIGGGFGQVGTVVLVQW